jgi:uridylate kinase
VRVVIKLSGEALSKAETKKFDNNIIFNIADQIKYLLENKNQISIVIGGGNFWRGRSNNSDLDRVKSDQIGMLATVMNALYISDIFRKKNIKSKILTPFVIGNITELFSKDLAIEYLNNNFVLIFGGGTGHPFFSTDTITAIRALELNVDCILYAKNIDGIYDSDPNKNSCAKKYKTITYQEIINKNLSAIDISAIDISKDLTSIVFALNKKNSIIQAFDETKICDIGTIVKKDIEINFC